MYWMPERLLFRKVINKGGFSIVKKDITESTHRLQLHSKLLYPTAEQSLQEYGKWSLVIILIFVMVFYFLRSLDKSCAHQNAITPNSQQAPSLVRPAPQGSCLCSSQIALLLQPLICSVPGPLACSLMWDSLAACYIVPITLHPVVCPWSLMRVIYAFLLFITYPAITFVSRCFTLCSAVLWIRLC